MNYTKIEDLNKLYELDNSFVEFDKYIGSSEKICTVIKLKNSYWNKWIYQFGYKIKILYIKIIELVKLKNSNTYLFFCAVWNISRLGKLYINMDTGYINMFFNLNDYSDSDPKDLSYRVHLNDNLITEKLCLSNKTFEDTYKLSTLIHTLDPKYINVTKENYKWKSDTLLILKN
jgi:hypothetical protein